MVEELLGGYARVRATSAADERETLRRLATEGQHPQALFVGCSDSRVVPELLTGARPGDLFVLRNIANRIPPWGEQDAGVAAVLEYAIDHLDVPDLIVCGHDGCGGVGAALGRRATARSRTRLERWLRGLQPAVARARATGASGDELLTRAVEENVLEGLVNLAAYPPVARATSAGRVRVHGWVYDIRDGALRVYDPARAAFVGA